ncbi:polysaccharide biosynthesis/export family protein [Bradyrhizobium sp. Tv2a-2]|uniref:polysaccharide biosynthesis/export family protein n=1 Tax=Bradyrhizobium sp. Tv2a-2 TaxID=113395 RepID=UPI000466BBCB|nr:polysaccharide biosynthesis/export family protein [Bradyrhizobium sp. Tv2a-2]
MRASRLPIIAVALALANSLPMTAVPAAAQSRNDLDYMAYGQPSAYGQNYAPAPPPAADSGGAIAALRRAFSSPASSYTQPQSYNPPAASTPSPQAYDAYAAAPMPSARSDAAYRLDAGDKLRVVVYGQDGLTNTYAIDAGGSITLPLIGSVPARGRTTAELASAITAKLRNGYIREPSVAVEIESYRPFFILGEVAAPGQYPYVPNMTVESAVAIAGGFSPRARRDTVTLTHTAGGGTGRYVVPLGTTVSPGDTVMVGERWF